MPSNTRGFFQADEKTARSRNIGSGMPLAPTPSRGQRVAPEQRLLKARASRGRRVRGLFGGSRGLLSPQSKGFGASFNRPCAFLYLPAFPNIIQNSGTILDTGIGGSTRPKRTLRAHTPERGKYIETKKIHHGPYLQHAVAQVYLIAALEAPKRLSAFAEACCRKRSRAPATAKGETVHEYRKTAPRTAKYKELLPGRHRKAHGTSPLLYFPRGKWDTVPVSKLSTDWQTPWSSRSTSYFTRKKKSLSPSPPA